MKRQLWRYIALILSPIILYLLAALIGSALAVNRQWQSATGPDGVDLFIQSNGVHVGLVVPLSHPLHDWSDLVRPDHLTSPDLYGTHLEIGWGHADVYRNAEQWKDLTVRDAFRGATGQGETLLHIYHLINPQAYPHYRRPFRVTPQQYRIIVQLIRARFKLDRQGHALPSKGYGPDDNFYEAHGRYNMFYTCNSWIADILGEAGIKAPLWTPFSGGVMWWFPDASQ